MFEWQEATRHDSKKLLEPVNKDRWKMISSSLSPDVSVIAIKESGFTTFLKKWEPLLAYT